MPLYSYSAVSQQGEKILGEETAKDEKELARTLYERGLILTFAKNKERKQSFSLPDLFGVSVADKLIFIRNLKVMVVAGVPLPRALEVLCEQAKNPKLRKALKEIQEKILKGNTLSGAIAGYPKIFSDLFVNMIRVGEESGTLENVLSQLHLQLEKQHQLQSKIMGALTYPVVIMVAMVGIGILMLVMVVPNLAKTFNDLGAQLPVTTRFIIGLGNFLTKRWYVALGLFVVLAIGFFQMLRSKMGKSFFDTAMLRFPIVSGISHKTNSATMLRTLSSLIASGVPIVRALEITSHVLGNSHYQKTLEKAAEEVKKGAKLSDSLRSYKTLYPALVIQMMEVGEETGQTAEVLAKLAEFFEDEVSQITQNLASIIEPMLMLVIGAVVGFFAISMIQPMYSVLGSIK